MTSLHRNLVVLLLYLTASPLLHSHLFCQAASTSRPVTRPRIIFMTHINSDDDYEEEEDGDFDDHSRSPEVVHTVRTTFLNHEPKFCKFNPCLEDQEPCAQLSTKTGCLCPGMSEPDQPPLAPRIDTLLPVSKGDDTGKVEVNWCAPLSIVSKYRVVIAGNDKDAQVFQASSRRGLVQSLEPGTQVCVQAVNQAGYSSPSEFSCQRYDPRHSTDQNMLLGVLVAGVALLLLVIIAAVIFWKYRMYKKAKRDSTDGLGNPSYSRGETL
ncbi:uncharacterized protein V6R79_025695 [Siganus canaliculatus]